jgi:vitamin B12 transporter
MIRRWKTGVFVPAALMALSGQAAWAQDDEALRRELDALERRRAEILERLRAGGKEAAPAPSGRPAGAPPAAPIAPEAGPPSPRGRAEATLEGVEVTATRYASAADRATASLSFVRGADLDRRGVTSVAEGLREVPGVSVARAGAPGAPTSVFLRGALSTQTLVLQDGIPLNDPTVGGQFNFFDLDTVNLDRIEVLRGSHGAVYGSDALGGVVHLVSRRGRGPGEFRLDLAGGSFDTQRQALHGSGGDDDADWSFGVSNERSHGHADRMGYHATAFSGRFGARVGGEGRLELAARVQDATAQDPFDFGNPLPLDPSLSRERELGAFGLTFDTPAAAWLDLRVRASYTDIDSEFRNRNDAPGVAPEFLSTSSGTTTLLGVSARARILEEDRDGASLDLVAGFDHETEESINYSDSPFGSGLVVDDTTIARGAYALATLGAGPVTVTAGARRDDHSQGGTETSPQAGARVQVAPRTALRAQYGEGFRSPTPAEFSDPFVGNAALGPERSRSFDAGVVQGIGPVELEASWFRLRTRDLIGFDLATFKLANIADARNEGLEVAARADLGHGWRARASYTRQRPRDGDTGARLANRPDSFGSAGVSWTSGAFDLGADVYAQGAVEDGGQTGPDARLREQAGRRIALDLSARWRVGRGWTLWAAVRNALDDAWVETPQAARSNPAGWILGATLEF